jgi:para-aminobenzoate synthetase component 1
MHIEISNADLLKAAAAEEVGVFLSSNHHEDPYGKYEVLAAGGAVAICEDNSFEALEAFLKVSRPWVFGGLTYDLKNDLEQLASENPNRIGFSGFLFFEPKWVVWDSGSGKQLWENPKVQGLNGPQPERYQEKTTNPISWKSALTKGEYIGRVKKLQAHIQLGDIYEVTYCMELFAEKAKLDPVNAFLRITEKTLAPFSSFLVSKNRYLLSASPERYLAKRGNMLVSQPIKGTSARFIDPHRDSQSARALLNSEKERAENVMIVDLVRNDLSKVAEKGSVAVPELFGIHSFKTVHQMISTVTARLDSANSLLDAIKATFPMGSMTGAPKVRAMQLIEEYETAKRGLFSGSVGYINPDGDADWNVVIRALQYDSQTGAASIQVGSAITIMADAAAEYDECLLKAEAIRTVFD